MPEASLRKTMVKSNFWRLAVHARGEIYIVFDDESVFQVENSQFRQPGPNIGKNLISKTNVFENLVFETTVPSTVALLVVSMSFLSFARVTNPYLELLTPPCY